jgi:hypothetical protein
MERNKQWQEIEREDESPDKASGPANAQDARTKSPAATVFPLTASEIRPAVACHESATTA